MPSPISPKLLKAGLVLLDPGTGAMRHIIALQYNPDTLTRTLQPQRGGRRGSVGSAPVKGPPVETIKLEAEIDATDQLEFPDQNPAAELGIHPQLAALETLVYPASARRSFRITLFVALIGMTLEILPTESDPGVVRVGHQPGVVPVRVTDFSVTEEDVRSATQSDHREGESRAPRLSVDDLGFAGKGGSLYMAYQIQKEALAKRATDAPLSDFGIQGSL